MSHTLKDPEWAPPPAEEEIKSETGLSTNGKLAVAPMRVHMPVKMQLAMEQHVRKAVLPESDRALPQAGLLFFEYRGKSKSIYSVELIYTGPAGKATLALQP